MLEKSGLFSKLYVLQQFSDLCQVHYRKGGGPRKASGPSTVDCSFHVANEKSRQGEGPGRLSFESYCECRYLLGFPVAAAVGWSKR